MDVGWSEDRPRWTQMPTGGIHEVLANRKSPKQALCRRVVLGGFAAIYVLPTLLFVLPLFITVVQPGMCDAYVGLVLSYVAFTLLLMVRIMGSSVRSIPVSVEEMARIDGASPVQLIGRFVPALLCPGIFAGLLLGFIPVCIELLTPLLFTGDLSILTVTLG